MVSYCERELNRGEQQVFCVIRLLHAISETTGTIDAAMPSSFTACGLFFLSLSTAVLLANGHGSAQISLVDSERVSKYEAPLRSCDSNVLPNQYIIYLATGMSLHEHKRRIGEP